MGSCDRCGTEQPESAKFCSECGARLDTGKAAQRKLATILFCDVVGSTALGEDLDAESVREVMLQFFGAMRKVIELHGGTTQKFIGDAVMAVFGVPIAREDDALRAVMAGLEMREELNALNEVLRGVYGLDLSVRIGINSGTVVAGDAMQDEALVLGDAVNVAARIEQHAAAGDVLLSESTFRLVSHSITVEAVPPIVAKGKSEPVTVYRLTGRRAERRRARLDSVAIVDREGPLAELMTAVGQVGETRQPQLLLLVGEAGIGKTRLVRELESQVEGLFLHGRCLPYGAGITYWPFAEVVREAAGILEVDTADTALARLATSMDGRPDPRVIAHLGQVLGLRQGEAGPEEIAWAARRYLECLAEPGPLVVCIDDLQWAEPLLLDLIESVPVGIDDAPILIVGMGRPELVQSRPAWSAIHLGQLEDEHIDALVARLADLDETARSKVVLRAGGSPLFVEELVVAVIEEPDRDLPLNIEALLTARIDRFSRAERYVLERGAVEGLVFHRSAVERLLVDREVALDDTLADLQESGVIVAEPAPLLGGRTYRFRHILIRDAVYEAIPKRVRGHLHELLAEWVLANHGGRAVEYEELIAWHLGRAYECRAEMGIMDEHTRTLAGSASDRLRSTARRAVARADLPAALSQLNRAVAMLEGDPEVQLELLPDLGEALRLSGEPERARDVLREAMERGEATHNATVTMVARVEDGLLRLTSDADVEAHEVADIAGEAIRMFEADGDQLRLAKAWALVGDTEWVRCQAQASETAFMRALDCLARAAAPGDPAWVLRLLALCYYTGPMPVDIAVERCSGLIERAQGSSATEVAIRASIGALEAMRGNFEVAREVFRCCKAIGEEFSLGPTVAGLSLLSGPVEVLAGDDDAAVRELRAGCEALEGYGQTGVLSTAAALLARTLERQGDLLAAERWTGLSERTAAPDDTASQIYSRGVRARLLARSGRLADAQSVAAEGVAIAQRTDFLVMHGEVLVDFGAVLHAGGDAVGAADAREQARRLFAAKGHSVLMAEGLDH
ncbi:MAG: adenylate/guanylate cyclase domain-containing protein [Acidimicrobiales bacterium]